MALVPSLQAGSLFGKYIFSHDSKYIFCCCGYVIKVFNTKNGEFLHELKGHTKIVTGIALNPSNILQTVSCGQDGRLIFWDYLDGVKLKQHDLHMALHGLISINAEKKTIMMLAQTTEHKINYSIMLWKKTPSAEYTKPKVIIENCSNNTNLVSFGCSKEYVACGWVHKLYIHSMKKGSTQVLTDKDKHNKGKAVMCVACHPTDYCIAAGLDNGKIILWYNFCNDGEPVASVIHWHALPVLCLAFTTEGSNLLSGGHECVLVKWQMSNTSRRDYKPRLGAPITDIVVSPEGTFYATKHTDNVIQLLDISLSIQQVYRGMTHTNCCDGRNPIPCGLKYDPKWRTIVTNGLIGHLQFYSVSLNRQIFNLDIVGQNYISPENVEQPKFVTEVLCSSISEDGDWLATFEMWDDGVFRPELRLKFWNYSTESQTYSLNTTVESPHNKKITSLIFCSMHQNFPDRSLTLVSVGSDACFKLWTLVDDSDIYRNNTCWTCEAVGSYHDFQALCADFSADGSTLIVAFEHLLTIWDPENNILCTKLSNSFQEKENIVKIKFGSGFHCHQVIAATAKRLVSWDLMTLTKLWSISAEISVLIKDPSSDLMAYISLDKKLCVFRPDSSQPIYEHDNISDHHVLDAVFVPNGRPKGLADIGWPGHSQLYIYNTEQQLITLDLNLEKQDSYNKVKIAQNLPENALKSMLAEKLVRNTNSQPVKETAAKMRSDDAFINTFLNSNEPISFYCDKFLHNFLVKKKTLKEKTPRDNLQAHAEDSSSSEEEPDDLPTLETSTTINNHKLLPDYGFNSLKEESDEDMDKLLPKSTCWVQWCFQEDKH